MERGIPAGQGPEHANASASARGMDPGQGEDLSEVLPGGEATGKCFSWPLLVVQLAGVARLEERLLPLWLSGLDLP